MTKTNINQLVCNGTENQQYDLKPQIFRNRRNRSAVNLQACISGEDRSLASIPIQLGGEGLVQEEPDQDNHRESVTLNGVSEGEPAPFRFDIVQAQQGVKFDFRYYKEHKARLRAEAKVRQLQVEFSVLAKRNEQATLDSAAAEYARLLALEAAERRVNASQTARLEAERKLKAEQDAVAMLHSQAEADRNAWQLQEQANVLLRKAEIKAQERQATEAMARKAAAFKLQTERELSLLADQRADAELKLAHEAELKLRAETKEINHANERLESIRMSRLLSGQNIEAKPCLAAITAHDIYE